MAGFSGLFLLYAVGVFGYLAFKRMRLMLPALLGSITAATILALSGCLPLAPTGQMSSVCKVVMGMMVGRRLNRNSVRMLGRLLGPAVLISVWMIALSVVGGYLLAHMAGLPLSTALIASSAGGVSEMAIFALSMNYDAATITIISVSRLVAVLVVTPWVAKRWSERMRARAQGEAIYAKPGYCDVDGIPLMSRCETAVLALLSLAGGWLFDRLGTPAGFMVGALFISGLLSLLSGKLCRFSPKVLAAAQIGIGVTIAQQFGPEQLAYLGNPRFVLSILFCGAFSILATLTLGVILQRMTGWDPLTCLLSTCAGGLSQMVVVSEEMKADSLTIGILHLARYLAIISCMPFLIRFLLQ